MSHRRLRIQWEGEGWLKTYTGELGAAVTALGGSSALLQVQSPELATGGLDNPRLVRRGVVPSSNRGLVLASTIFPAGRPRRDKVVQFRRLNQRTREDIEERTGCGGGR